MLGPGSPRITTIISWEELGSANEECWKKGNDATNSYATSQNSIATFLEKGAECMGDAFRRKGPVISSLTISKSGSICCPRAECLRLHGHGDLESTSQLSSVGHA